MMDVGLASINRLPGLPLAIVVLLSSHLVAAERAPLVLPLWPDLKVPADQETVEDRSHDPRKPDRAYKGVFAPEITISWPVGETAHAPAAVICPGGGYGKVVIDKEGHAIAQWLNGMGFVAAVLKYRLPVPGGEQPEVPLPIQDGMRAIRLLRERAEEWGIDPHRIGIVGSSAGGHLASTVSTHFASLPANGEKVSARPDFQLLLYPVIVMDQTAVTHPGSRDSLLGKDASPERQKFYSNDLQVTAQTPPAFIVHAKDDKGVPLANSQRYRDALLAAGVPAELLILETGGHGFGLGAKGGEPAAWPPVGAEWLKKQIENPQP